MPTHPATAPFLRLVGTLQSAAQPRARVESEPDPNRPGRVAYRVSGPTRGAVQAEIDRLTATVDVALGGAPGFANFIGPHRLAGAFVALGEVVVEPEVRI